MLIEASQIHLSLLMLALSCTVASTSCCLLIRYKHLHLHLSQDPVNSGPQKCHTIAQPRIGGIALFMGLILTSFIPYLVQEQLPLENFGFLLLAALPAFAGGLVEDITKDVSISNRLMLNMLAAGLGAWLLGAILPRVDVSVLDAMLRWSPLAIVFTMFLVSGVGNAINIIDGCNGLAAGYSLLALAAMAWVSSQVGDIFLFTSALAMIGALLGFLAWNYPHGLIFLGDSGAYLLGFWLAEISVLLVVRHPEVSAWFPLLLLAYPVVETLFSIVRRKLWHGTSPGEADGLHLHQLLYRKLARGMPPAIDVVSALKINNAVAPRVCLVTTLCCIAPALMLWRDAMWLTAISWGIWPVYIGVYVWLTKTDSRHLGKA